MNVSKVSYHLTLAKNNESKTTNAYNKKIVFHIKISEWISNTKESLKQPDLML